MIVKTSELRAVFEALMTHYEASGIHQMKIDKDYYWYIPSHELYDFDHPLREPDIGQLSHDWERLTAISSGEMPPVGFGLAWLGDVLRAVSERMLA